MGFPSLPTGAPEPGRGSPWWVGTGKTLSHLGPSWVLAPDGLSVTPAWQPGAARESGQPSCSVPGTCRFPRSHQACLPPDKGQQDIGRPRGPGLAPRWRVRTGQTSWGHSQGPHTCANTVRPALGPLGLCGVAGRRGGWPAGRTTEPRSPDRHSPRRGPAGRATGAPVPRQTASRVRTSGPPAPASHVPSMRSQFQGPVRAWPPPGDCAGYFGGGLLWDGFPQCLFSTDTFRLRIQLFHRHSGFFLGRVF